MNYSNLMKLIINFSVKSLTEKYIIKFVIQLYLLIQIYFCKLTENSKVLNFLKLPSFDLNPLRNRLVGGVKGIGYPLVDSTWYFQHILCPKCAHLLMNPQVKLSWRWKHDFPALDESIQSKDAKFDTFGSFWSDLMLIYGGRSLKDLQKC